MNEETINQPMDQHDKIQAIIAKLIDETGRLIDETAKLNSENRYYPIIITASATLAIVAIAKLFL